MKIRKIVWGLFFIAAAAFVLMLYLGSFENISLLPVLISILLVPVIIESLVHLNFLGVFFPLAFLGILYAEPLGITAITPWPILFAALFLTIGFEIIFSRLKKRWWNKDWLGKHHHYVRDEYETVETIEGEGDVNCDVNFGSGTKYLHTPNLRKASFSCSFGALKVYFDGAQLHPDGAQIEIKCSFGGMELYIPKTWQVIDQVTATLGGMSEKNLHGPVSGPALTLTGHVSLGGVEIIYV